MTDANDDLTVLLAAVTATGVSASVDLGANYDEFSLEVEDTGSPASISVQFQGSLDRVNWFSIGTAIVAATAGTVVTGVIARYVRANLGTLSGGTAPSVTASIGFTRH